MTDQQPEALRLANEAMCRLPGNDGAEIAAELRRLHADAEHSEKHRNDLADSIVQLRTQIAALSRLQAGGQGVVPALPSNDASVKANMREAMNAIADKTAAPALVPLPADQVVNPYIHSKGAASVWLCGFRAGERAHGIGLTVGGDGGAKRIGTNYCCEKAVGIGKAVCDDCEESNRLHGDASE